MEMIKVKITNKKTNDVMVVDVSHLEMAKINNEQTLLSTARWLASKQSTGDWSYGYESYEDFMLSVTEDIFEDLRSYYIYEVLKEPMTIKQIIQELEKVDEDMKNLPLYFYDKHSDSNLPVYSIGVYDESDFHSPVNPLILDTKYDN